MSCARRTARVNGLDPAPATCSVEAYNSSGNVSAPSATTGPTPTGNIPLPPAVVQGLQLMPVGPNAVQVSWQVSPQAVNYLIYYTVIFSTGSRAAAAPPPSGLLGGSLTGGFRALEGRSPLSAGGATRARLGGRWMRTAVLAMPARRGAASSAARRCCSRRSSRMPRSLTRAHEQPCKSG